MSKTKSGFTIVELLIVIVVIGILAAITVVAYSGIQDRAKSAKIKSDVANLAKAMVVAKQQTGKTIVELTTTTTIGSNNTGTGRGCWNQASGTDLSAVAKTNKCWTDYYETLQILSDASGIHVVGLLDPYNRPYYIDQTEGENVNGNYCVKDVVATFKLPHVGGSASVAIDQANAVAIPNISPGC